ncbi:ketoacyl-ACP synthase III family protein [Kitasatospora sp. NBC_01250]|uniref:ketoacyl-ACP synthase III family protein n=1 Tax=Kitasatospora sp. NBC_01250 TaxID=2903571 RepID=UPI002E35596F|nr:ketoacyl-ACP synthase III family protein [Kitasatospora sp. NBC_01250]
MKVQDIYIDSVGTYVPEIFSSADAVAQGLYDADMYEEAELTGVAISPGVSGPDMAVRAAQQAFERATLTRADIDAVFHASCFYEGPDAWCAQNYVQLKAVGEAVGHSVPAFEVRHGCNGMFDAFELAVCYLRASEDRDTALITTGDNMDSPLMDRWRSVPFQLIGDAGAATVLTKRGGFARLRSVGTVLVQELEGLHRGAEPLFPPPPTTRVPLDMATRSAQYFAGRPYGEFNELSLGGLNTLVARLTEEAGVKLADIARVSYMSVSRDFTEQRLMVPLGLPMEKSSWEYARGVGHLATSDHLAAFDHLVGTGALVPGDLMLMIGLAHGLSIAGAVIEITATPPWLR